MNCQPTDPLLFWFEVAWNLLAAYTLGGLVSWGFGWLVSLGGRK